MTVLDVTDEAFVHRAVATVLGAEGRLDVVVSCAGFVMAGAVEDVSIEEAQRQMDTHFFGVLRVCRAVLPAMRAQRSGHIEATLLSPGEVRTHVRQYRERARCSGPGSAYQDAFERVMNVVESGEGAGIAPEQVARKVLALVERQHVDVRCSVGHLSQRAAWVSKRLLPARTFEHIVMSLHGLSRR
ncbi:hypothetical protein GCM10012319_73280 [Comamonas sp. KCTC 72670]|nr:hypothetical protein GCM10012319_73280 [Comamonas sp. KCTC 72670]